MKIRVYLTGVFLAICVFAEALAFVGNNCDFPDNWQVMKTTEDGADKALLDFIQSRCGCLQESKK